MANLALEEADRFFSYREHSAPHPEDRDNDSTHSDSNIDQGLFQHNGDAHSDPGTDEDTIHDMATLTATKTTFRLPSTTQYANTGPKGVIADAQSFARAKQNTLRQRLVSIASNFGSSKTQIPAITEEKGRDNSSGSESDLTLSEEENDSEFMNTWRANRLQELSAQSQGKYTRRVSPSRRTWGALTEVDANGYLDAIEKVSDETVVVVMIFNPESSESTVVEDELGTLAYKYSTTRFVKLHHETAEMETVQIPAVLAYQAGDVFATISGVQAEGLESVLKQHRILR